MKKIDKFINNYNKDFIKLVSPDKGTRDKIIKFYQLIIRTKNKGNKIIIAGNGGSAAIASHFSVDMTKNGGVRCINFNESDLLTCFSNDYGYENWLKQAIKFYADQGDLIILISASGNSENMVNAANYSKKMKNFLITFTGFNGKNKLSKKGNINFVVDSKNYNFIENIHQYWLLILVDIMSESKK